MSDAETDEAWERVMSSWEDEQAHTAFIMLCQSRRTLADAARRYRSLNDPGSPFRGRSDRLEEINKRLRSLTALALAELEASKTEPQPSPWLWPLRVFAILLALGALYLFFRIAVR